MGAIGIDLGGTKIAARVFDGAWSEIWAETRPTPGDYPALLDALAASVAGARGAGGTGTVGLASPGLVADGVLRAVNLAADGRTLAADLAARVGPTAWVNDARAFAVSEAAMGAGRGAPVMLALILGTGMSGAVVAGGRLPPGSAAAGEFGHSPLPAPLVAAHGLPLLECPCGRRGCAETLAAGPGLPRLAAHLGLPGLDPQAAGARPEVRTLWAEVVATALVAPVLTAGPQRVVLGGGLARLPGAAPGIGEALRAALPSFAEAPEVVLAEGGPESGARGAAMAAQR